MTSPTGVVLVDEPRNGVLRVRLNRPERHNAINAELLAGLETAFDHPAACAIVLGSSTAGRFCSGADLAIDDAERAGVSDGLYRLYARIIALEVPVIAALGGPAVGGGGQLAIACDLRIAAPDAWLRFVGPGHGLAVGAWGLPALVGRSRALDLCLTSRRVSAAEGLAMGLVDRVADDADDAALEMAAALAELDRSAVARVKAIVDHTADRAAALESEASGNRAWGGSVPRR
jgi:enoyl-CoA hydratase/carnithine racemase